MSFRILNTEIYSSYKILTDQTDQTVKEIQTAGLTDALQEVTYAHRTDPTSAGSDIWCNVAV